MNVKQIIVVMASFVKISMNVYQIHHVMSMQRATIQKDLTHAYVTMDSVVTKLLVTTSTNVWTVDAVSMPPVRTPSVHSFVSAKLDLKEMG